MVGMHAVGEGMLEHRVVEAQLMMRGGEGLEGTLAAGELEDRGTRHGPESRSGHIRGSTAVGDMTDPIEGM